jgi:AcrR family transcriptional regulator
VGDHERGRRGARDERRQQLLAAARQVFASRGYHAATVDDITRVAGVAKGTFYLYFAEKRAVFYELIRQFFDRVTEVGSSVGGEVAEREEYFRRIEIAAQRLAELFRAERDVVKLVYRESMGLDEELERMVREFYRHLAQVEAENVRLGVKLGLFRDDLHPVIVAYAQIGMVERVLLAWLFDRSFPSDASLVAQLVELAYRGVRR